MRPPGRRLADAGSRALRRATADVWLLLQGTAAATAAWGIARYVLDHEQPFFAPIAALVARNPSLGERGLDAVRLLQESDTRDRRRRARARRARRWLRLDGRGDLCATALARALGGTRIVVAQATVGAILYCRRQRRRRRRGGSRRHPGAACRHAGAGTRTEVTIRPVATAARPVAAAPPQPLLLACCSCTTRAVQ